MAKPTFVFQQVSNHGASHPVVARLTLQTDDLLKAAGFGKETREAVMEVYMGLQTRLLHCYDLADKIFTERDRTMNAFLLELSKGNHSLPFVIDLQVNAESFLLAAKQYLRDLVKALNLLFGANLPVDAKVFWNKAGPENSEIVKWATAKFGTDHHITRMFADDNGWISELVKKRNAVEHPGDKNGTLIIENFRVKNGAVVPPTWYRDGSKNPTPSEIFRDLRAMRENMLTLGEDMVVVAIEQKGLHEILRIAEIPEDKRDPKTPKRFQIVLSQEALASSPTAHE
ncbi:hypothetical protein BMJ20_33505 [Sinorhizobium medicae]|uniref:hypothetical protein n=1 Tax=Sinorhizobium medicae TaxID=110321 RepID=UPI0011B4997A|nr:hypothetical protein [Sinorhizobium medicae]PLU57382.1 hypothetical protein BMJ24_17385 [Sinorhizobium medicae]PLU65097.1 hypothetical protein BMJ20_33505 [Sinorhizobium medicae]